MIIKCIIPLDVTFEHECMNFCLKNEESKQSFFPLKDENTCKGGKTIKPSIKDYENISISYYLIYFEVSFPRYFNMVSPCFQEFRTLFLNHSLLYMSPIINSVLPFRNTLQIIFYIGTIQQWTLRLIFFIFYIILLLMRKKKLSLWKMRKILRSMERYRTYTTLLF